MATSQPHHDLSDNQRPAAPCLPQPGRRLESLDIFRGLTIAGMILVNDPGSDASYWPLCYADELNRRASHRLVSR